MKILFLIFASLLCTFAFCQGQVSVGELGGPPQQLPPPTVRPYSGNGLNVGLTGMRLNMNGSVRVGGETRYSEPLNTFRERVVPFTENRGVEHEVSSGIGWSTSHQAVTITGTPTGFITTISQSCEAISSVNWFRTWTNSFFESKCTIFLYFEANVVLKITPRITIYSEGTNSPEDRGHSTGSIKLCRYLVAGFGSMFFPQAPRDILAPSPFELNRVFPPFQGNDTVRPGTMQREVGPGLYAIEVRTDVSAVCLREFTRVRERVTGFVSVEVAPPT